MCRNAAGHTFMVSDGITALSKTNENVNEIGQPTDKKRAHEPMAELNDVIDLVAVFRNIRRLTQEFVDQRQTSHISQDPRRSIVRAAPTAHLHAARGGRQKHSPRRELTPPRQS